MTSLDVIEHVRLDTVAFSELARVTRPGGHIVVTLPVNPRLYSSFDCLCGHLRRYTFEDIQAIADATRLELRRISCYAALTHFATRYYMYKGDIVKGLGKFEGGMESRAAWYQRGPHGPVPPGGAAAAPRRPALGLLPGRPLPQIPRVMSLRGACDEAIMK